MRTIKTLTLAAAAALTLGMGGAMAQQALTTKPNIYYLTQPNGTQAATGQTGVQSGSSDVDNGFRVGMPGHFRPFNEDNWGTGNGGG